MSEHRMVETPAPGRQQGGVEQVVVIYRDFTGLGRAWAKGPRSRLDEVRERAREELDLYIGKRQKLGETWVCDEDFNEEVVDV